MDIVGDLLLLIQGSLSCATRMTVVERNNDGFTIQVGSNPNALITVTIDDTEGPKFSATYPRMVTDRNGTQAVTDYTSVGILDQGVAWIVRKVFRFGFVPPEGYRKEQRNAGKAEQPWSEGME